MRSRSSCAAKVSVRQLYPFVGSHGGPGVEQVVRVVFGLDLPQGLVVGAVERFLEVGLAEISLAEEELVGR